MNVIRVLADADSQIPMEAGHAIKFKGIGKRAISQLEQMGLINKSPLSGLSFRAANCLAGAGIETKDQARKAMVEGRLNPDASRLDRVRNYGLKTHKEVCKWLDSPNP